MIKVGELFAEIKLVGGMQAISSMKGLLKSSLAAKAGIAGAVAALYKLTDAARDYAMVLDKYEASTGKSAEELQEWSYRAAQAGVSTEELAQNIQHLQQIKNKVLLGEGMPGAFMLGQIDPNTDPLDILDQVAEKVKQLPPDLARTALEGLGLSENIFYMLQTTDKEMGKLEKKYLVTRKQKADLVKLNAEWKKLWFFVKQISTRLTAIGAEFQLKFVKVLTRALMVVGDLAEKFMNWFNALGDMKNLLLVIGAIVAAWLLPWGGWLALVAAIALVLEDIWVFFQGGDSVTGAIVEWVKSSETLRDIWDALVGVFRIAVPVITAAGKAIWTIVSTIAQNTGLWDVLKKIGSEIADMFKTALKVINMAIDGWLMLTQTKAGQWALKKMGIDDDINSYASQRLNERGFGELVAPQNQGLMNTNNNNNVNTHITQYIQGADAATVKDAAQEGVSDALYQNPALTGAI